MKNVSMEHIVRLVPLPAAAAESAWGSCARRAPPFLSGHKVNPPPALTVSR